MENGEIYVNELNSLFTRFERHDFCEACNVVMTVIRNRTDERIVVSDERVRQSLRG